MLKADIWNNILIDVTLKNKIIEEVLPEYSIPFGDEKGIKEYVIGYSINPMEFLGNNRNTKTLNDENIDIQPDLSRVLENNAVRIILENTINVRNKIDVNIVLKYGNALSLRGYGGKERAIVTLQGDSQEIQAFSNKNDATVIESGTGMFSELTLFDNKLNEKNKVSVNKDETPDKFIENLSGIQYENGDLVKVKMMSNKRIDHYMDSELATYHDDFLNTEEWFQIDNNGFKRILNSVPNAEYRDQTITIGTKLSPIDFIKKIDDFFGEVQLRFKEEPQWEKFGDQIVSINLKNNIGAETTISVKLTILRGNSISLRGYIPTDERVLVFLNSEKEKIQSVTDLTRNNVVDSGSGLYWTLTHVSGEIN